METIKLQLKIKHIEGADLGYINYHEDLYKMHIKASTFNDTITLIEIGTILTFMDKNYKVEKIATKFFKTRNDSGRIEFSETEEYPSYNYEIVYGVVEVQ
jgi:hypothetical protein